MNGKRLNEQTQRAQARYAKDIDRRGERGQHIAEMRKKRGKPEWALIDDAARISARARMLGMVDATELRVLERILGDDELMSADFLRVGARVSSCVGRIHIRDQHRRRAGFGTGFMISRRLMMTNNHVLGSAADAANSTIEFDFVEGLTDSVQRSSFFSLDPQMFFITSRSLDYSIVAVGSEYVDSEAQRRGWLQLIEESGKLLVGERLNIVQHPEGGPQKVALRRNSLESVDGDFLIYTTDTQRGSSGSPVCNDQWLLAALHHASVPEFDQNGKFVGWIANEGVRISSIVADLRQRLGGKETTSVLFDETFQTAPVESKAADASLLCSDGAIEIPLRVSLTIGAQTMRVETPAANLPPPSTQSEPVERDEFIDPPDGLPAFAKPTLECIVVRLADGDDSIVGELAENWTVEPVDEDNSPRDFDLLPRDEISVEDAWNAVHQLRGDARLLLAEPCWEVDAASEDERLPATAELFGLFRTATDRAAEAVRWAPQQLRVKQAWAVSLPPGGRARGEGIRVCHPDSGFTQHSELVERPNAIDVASGYDFVADDPDPIDTDGFHGTGTASVMMSGALNDILGVAPEVTLVPMRIAQRGIFRPSPVLLRSGMRRLRRAIARAIDKDCHVVSISLGWFGYTALHDVIKRAWEQDIIIVAAAGNYTGPLIVWPARYRECICMAGCDARRGIWKGSARGSRVDFSAPAQDVWKAGFAGGAETTMQSSGTSFAAAMTAGLAALWLAHHGRQNLLDRYQATGVRLTEVFRTVLARSAGDPPSSGFGGIVNAEQALRTPLPAPGEVRRSFEHEAMTAGIDVPAGTDGPSLSTALEILGTSYKQGRRRLADGLGVAEAALEAIADGCGDELAFHAILSSDGSSNAALERMATPSLETSGMSQRLRRQLADA